MPKGVRPLEEMFDSQSKFRKLANVNTKNSSMQYELVNLGSEAEPNFFNLGKCCSPRERCKFLKLIQQYKYIFAWTYKYLKTYDTCIIQHVIPIKIGINPFQQQLGKMHPKLEPLIKKELKKLLDPKIIFNV